MRQLWPAIAILLALAVPPPARADDVTDQIGQALTAYKNKDLSTAATALDTAASLIRQMKAEIWKSALPAPLSGWTADKPESQALAPALLGGATTVSRAYHKSGNTVTISIIADSPIVEGIAAFLSSGVGGLVAGSQLAVVGGRRVLYSKDDNSYQTMVGSRVLLKVVGSHGTDAAVLRQYLGAVDFAAIEKMAK